MDFNISTDIVKKLTKMIQDEDITIRQKTTESLLTIAGSATGRLALVKQGSLLYLSKLFDDQDVLIRRNTHSILARVTISYQGVENLLSYSVTSILVQKLSIEKYDIQIPILETLSNCIRLGKEPMNPGDAIKSDAVTVFTSLLQNSSVSQVKVLAANALMALTFFPEAKKLACKGNTMTVLISLLLHGKSEVRAAVAGALMRFDIFKQFEIYII